jgi:hypothetical protein
LIAIAISDEGLTPLSGNMPNCAEKLERYTTEYGIPAQDAGFDSG